MALQVLIGTELNPEDDARLRSAFPDVTFVQATGREAIKAAAESVEVLFGHVDEEILAAAPHLRWVQTRSAGVNGLPLDALFGRGIALTRASGAHGIPIAENILAMMFAFAIRLPALFRGQMAKEWMADRIRPEKFELDSHTLLVIGLGDLGGTLAAKASALGMHVLGIRKRALPPPPGVDRLFTSDQLHAALGQADHVALCLPLTDETTAYLDEPELRAMKRTAYVYNAGRGKSIARDPLLRALQEGWIAGAGLDVTDPEPLPPDDPLWSLPTVILTQHTSGSSPANSRRVTDLFIENLTRYRAGETLRNLVDPKLGY